MNKVTQTIKSPRIEVVDALRGFAILSIMLLHNIEHFDFYFFPEYFPDWLKATDKIIWDTLFFLFGGKSYAIFALLFGFSFYIQNDNQDKLGNDFRFRFFWRMILLFGFGFINTIFYEGDILMFYAVLGLALIPVCKWSTKAVFITALFLIAQPLEWAKYIYILFHQEYVPTPNLSDFYFSKMGAYLNSTSFVDYAIGNIQIGKLAAMFWSWENGRFLQAPALFMFGMLLGRKKMFVLTTETTAFWSKALLYSAIQFIPLYTLKTILPDLISRKAELDRLMVIITSWSNVAFMTVLVSLFVKLYQTKNVNKILMKLVPFGKMSLTNYIMQSVVGAFIYYKYGLGLVEYTGATYSLFIGITLFLLQLSFCKWWLKSHKQGPLEAIWHKATWISIGKK